jgi:hypothetical protein
VKLARMYQECEMKPLGTEPQPPELAGGGGGEAGT